MIIPEIDSSFRYPSHISASFFQSVEDMFSDHFMNGLIKIGLQISLSSGAMFRIVSLSVEITPPDFVSSLEEIVPPVIIIATFGSLLSCFSSSGFLSVDLCFSRTVASRISFSRIPML